jgi:hypothetical protein
MLMGALRSFGGFSRHAVTFRAFHGHIGQKLLEWLLVYEHLHFVICFLYMTSSISFQYSVVHASSCSDILISTAP